MREILDIRQFIKARAPTEKLVLCTLVRKQGSSYRSVGAKKVISLSGLSVGLLSGGCLEASIEKAARERYHELPFTMTFDMLSDDDRLLGYQTGCQGSIDILFEKANTDTDLDQFVPYDPIELVIVGCGADADAYVPLADSMGWKLRLMDYRRDMVARFGDRALHMSLSQLPRHIPQGPRVAVVLMTHNYESDLEILNGIKSHNLGYLGCLGPAGRFTKLKDDLNKMHKSALSSDLLEVSHAPVGIFPYSRSPEEIALSVIAQIQQELVERHHGRVWTLILAAGASQRFGSPKALAPIGEHSFLSRALDTAHAFSGTKTLVVTGAHHESISSKIDGHQVFNKNWSEGMSSSLRCGLNKILELDSGTDGIVVLPVDQPLVTPEHLNALSELGQAAKRCALTSYKGAGGPPAYIPKKYFTLIDFLNGDRGLKSALSIDQTVYLENEAAFRDFDS